MNSNINPQDIANIVDAGIENIPEFITALGKLASHPQLNLILLTILAIASAYAFKRLDNMLKNFIAPILEQQYGIKFPKTFGQRARDWWQRLKLKFKRKKKK